MWRIVLLSVAAFLSQTGEYMPVALQPGIAAEFGSQVAAAPLLWLYAWIVAATALPLTLLTGRIPSHRLIAVLCGLLGLGTFVLAVVDDLSTMAMARATTAMAHGLFWSLLVPVAAAQTGGVGSTRATAVAFAGIAIASLAGVPALSLAGEVFGWRSACLLLAMLLVLAAPGLWWGLLGATTRTRSSLGMPRTWYLPIFCIGTICITFGHFSAYAFAAPIFASIVGEGRESALFLLFGIAGLGGIACLASLDLPPHRLAQVSAVGIACSMGLILHEGALLAGIGVFLWGASSTTIVVGLQTAIIARYPDHSETVSALHVACFNFGLGLGAMAGILIGGTGQKVLVPAIIAVSVGVGALFVSERNGKCGSFSE